VSGLLNTAHALITDGDRIRWLLLLTLFQATPTKQEEWESVSERTVKGEKSIRQALRADLDRINSFGQRVFGALWPLRRWFRQM
jgi:hypothetical protein